jgi:hypothetical protein
LFELPRYAILTKGSMGLRPSFQRKLKMESTTMTQSKKSAPKPENPEGVFVRYSPNYEFPLSSLLSFGAHLLVLIAAIVLAKFIWKPDREPVPIGAAVVVDDTLPPGAGKQGSGGGGKEFEENVREPSMPKPPLNETELQLVETKVTAWAPDIKIDPKAMEQIARSPNIEKFDRLSDDLKRKLLEGLGNKKGQGQGTGKNPGANEGDGNGGTGNADTTSARNLRWTLSFENVTPRTYFERIQALGGKLFFVRAQRGDRAVRFTPDKGDRGEDSDLSGISGIIFIDERRMMLDEMRQELRLDFMPSQMIANFPPELEDDLRKKEIAYRGLKPEAIFETVFTVTSRNGKVEAFVSRQTPMRR